MRMIQIFLPAGDRDSFESCIAVTDNLGRNSRLYMNAGKTSVVWLGSSKSSTIKYMHSEWNGISQN